MSPQSAILFDLDGTLLDTARDFHGIINRMLAQHGRPSISYDSLRTQVSNGARAMVRHAFELNQDHPEFAALHQQLLDDYAGTDYPDSRAFSGIEELVDWLENSKHPWGIVTNKPERFTRPLLQQVGLGQCQCIICPEQVKQTKPDPEGLVLACEILGSRPEDSIYVGDHIRDIEAGRAAGMKTVAAAWGYLNEGESCSDWDADYICAQAEDLRPLLHSILQAH
ncbi:HAD family hydrolase [Marinobacterium stanieri]|uniref:HAD family hydrolase n=1 Tax=Marinobacterium stanieri TaxID=49186 RepID=UPI003A8F3A1D